ncbi:MAG: carbon storage regulator [Patescibacteria group bacterium]
MCCQLAHLGTPQITTNEDSAIRQEDVAMLVMKRTYGDVVRIGPATITVVSVKGRVVEIGVEAPWWMPILRGELPWNYLLQLKNAVIRLWVQFWRRQAIGPPRPGS